MDDVFIRIQGHEIIGIPDQARNTVHSIAFSPPKPFCDCLLQSVQRHIRK